MASIKILEAIKELNEALESSFGQDGNPKQSFNFAGSNIDDQVWNELRNLTQSILHINTSGGGFPVVIDAFTKNDWDGASPSAGTLLWDVSKFDMATPGKYRIEIAGRTQTSSGSGGFYASFIHDTAVTPGVFTCMAYDSDGGDPFWIHGQVNNNNELLLYAGIQLYADSPVADCLLVTKVA